ncbi:acetyl-coenzyme A synthetase, cytoplasmic-like isoform X3 [Sinocyclocheilus grahami]|uniref:Propionate--CoA ligase n=1 Tax=Sinocyclocheilus grahami TaxID=75366 RepID=A0A672R8A2_SINGR|nr:PREDICTED: acetyl-coenzyme A synthetase, cytoplasmic-like isoform X3 [Sinocyclocheilus grahami]
MIPDKAPGEDVLHASGDLKKEAHVPSFEKYKELYIRSVESPEEFWGDVAKDFFWKTKYTGKFLDYNFDVTKGEIFVKCMEGATTNICYNVLDRNIYERKLGDKVAFYWEGNEPGDEKTVAYRELLQQVCKFANVLKSQGVKKGDRVSIYMPMVVELVVAMLACARIGAVHSIVFAGFSAESLCERIIDSQCCILITADGFYRGDKLINLKLIADEALQKCRDKSFTVEKCIMLKHLTKEDEAWSGSLSPPAKRACPDLQQEKQKERVRKVRPPPQVPWNPEVDLCWHSLIGGASEECEPVWCDSEDPLFILYTSGSTGKPKFEGLPTYPDVSRMWEIVDKYHISKFYTAPTAIRLLMKYGSEPVQKYKRTSLKILGTVGEPINPEAWQWYYSVVGEKRCPVVDTFWQTETGGHVMTPLPAATPMKPGSATFPFFGVVPAILNESGEELEGPSEGYLVFKQPWPGVMRTVYGNHERFETTYFKKFPGFYVTGDGCRRDKDGYYWITGRIDDMLNVSGHLLSTAEVESALVEHEAVAEAAVVGRPHPVKGESLYCFVTLNDGINYNQKLEGELKKQVREKIGAIATPDYIQNAPSLPKTRSGKIMRRVLRKIACNERDLGDVSTLADSSVIEQLFDNRCCTAV